MADLAQIGQIWFAESGMTIAAPAAIALLFVASLWFFRRRRRKQAAARPFGRAALALQSARLGLWDCRPAENRLDVSPRIARQLGFPAHHFDGTLNSFWQQIHPDDKEAAQTSLNEAARKGKTPFQIELRLLAHGGAEIWFELAGASVTPAKSKQPHLIGVLGDISQRKQSEHQLRHESSHDTLTGLPRRSLLLQLITRLLEHAPGEQGPAPALILFNVNRFKMVNEQLGHEGGDKFLAALARRFTSLRPMGSEAARVHDDRFALLLPSDSRDRREQAGKIVTELGRPVNIGGRDIFPDISAGIADIRKHHQHAEEVLEEAGRALEEARGQQQRQPAIGLANATDGKAQRRRRMELENDLHNALERGEIRLSYQPLMDLAEGIPAGFEALMRWNHAKFGAVSPNEFIPLAEETGLIGGLTYSALAAAAQEAAHWQKIYRRQPPLFVCVNLSRRELFQDALVPYLEQALSRAQLAAGSLCLELTETILLHHPQQAVPILEKLQAAGASIAIDDFGKGYSNLAQLAHMKCNMLKLDQSLIANLPHDKTAEGILRAITGMGKSLSLKIVAEGVDSAEKLEAVRKAGCDYAQGFYFAKPMSAAEVREFLPQTYKPKPTSPTGNPVSGTPHLA